MSLYDRVKKEHGKMQEAYYASQYDSGKCPHCGTRIVAVVKNPNTGKIDTCPACGKKVTPLTPDR